MKRREDERGTKEDLVRYRIENAQDDIRSATLLLEAGEFKSANNRAYYAIFHAIRAILAIEGKDFKKHKDVIAYFNREYVKTEIFPRVLGRGIFEAEEIRHASDYDDFYLATKSEAEDVLTIAKDFLELAVAYCEKELGCERV